MEETIGDPSSRQNENSFICSEQQLKRRDISSSDVCVCCSRDEQAAHTLLFCQFVYEV
jgi:hypothetical protein